LCEIATAQQDKKHKAFYYWKLNTKFEQMQKHSSSKHEKTVSEIKSTINKRHSKTQQNKEQILTLSKEIDTHDQHIKVSEQKLEEKKS
jgi:predicted transcriptional regulator